MRQTVFPETTGVPLAWPLRLANRLHHRTCERVVRHEILFREGSLLDTLRLRESERLLRERNFFESVEISHRIEQDRNVVRVRTQDLWTLGIVLNYEKQADISSLNFGLRDTNFLGTGNSLYWSQTVSTDQDALHLAAVLPRLARTRAAASVLYSEQGDGIMRSAGLGRHHQTIFDRWGWGVGALDADGVQRFFRSGEEYGLSRFRREDLEGYLGRYSVRRVEYGFGAGWVVRTLSPTGDPETSGGSSIAPPAFEPRRHGGPLLFGGLMRRRFVAIRNVERYGTTEDIPLGWAVHISAGPNLRWKSDTSHAFAVRGLLSGSLFPVPHCGIAGEVAGAVFFRSDRTAGERHLRAVGSAGWRPTPRTLTFAQATLLLGADRPATTVYYFGTDAGLRGFPTREIEARDYLLATLEQRFWSGIEVLWVGLGGNLFIDSCLPASNGRLAGNPLRTGCGGGMLLGLRKSSQRPVRIEVAWRTDRRSSPTFSISTSTQLRLAPRVVLPQPTQLFAAPSR